jgi:valyl-tRNA synthetase
MGSKFCNKIWNASRYILGNLEGRTLIPVKDEELTELDRWIYSELNKVAASAREALDNYRYNDASSAVYEFFWNEFCDWYVEATKLSFWHGDEHEKDRAVSVLLNILEESLRLMHPFVPFVTEEIYSKLPLAQIVENRKKAGNCSVLSNSVYDGMLINAPYPEPCAGREDKNISLRFDSLKEIIGKVRALRTECGIEPAAKINVALKIEKGSSAEVAREKSDMMSLLAGLSKVEFIDKTPEKAIGTVGSGFEAFLLVDENINKDQLKTRFTKEIEKAQKSCQMSQNKLNGNFAKNAPAEVVQQERDRLAESQQRIEKLEGYLKSL